jgi:hypothetical protein
VHINALEFIVLILQLAAINTRCRDMPPAIATRLFPLGLPDIPVWLGRTDNMVSKSWESKASATGRQGQSLLSVYSELLRTTRVATQCTHVSGVTNIVADDISRNDFSSPFQLRRQQLFATHPSLTCLDYFLPSPALIQLLTSKLYSAPAPIPCVLPKILGHFVPADCTTLSSPSI